MQFNSYIFILVFVPVLLIIYFGLNKISLTLGKLCLIVGSAVFYIYGGWRAAVVLGCSILANYIFAVLMNRIEKGKKLSFGISIIINVALLFYYKYFNFFLSGINGALKTDFVFKEIILPLGISFFTFQQIMYLVNIYNRDIEEVQILDYLTYVLYFPKLLMGPLVEPVDLIKQINDRERKHINWDNISYGIKLFSFGLFKKLLLADTFSAAVMWGYGNIDEITAMDGFLIMLFYTFEIYFDFSGYSDMAVGVSMMLNIDLPMNFNSPYKALSIRDFWKRWHISLTSFLTRYIFVPLGGSRRGKKRTYINTMIVFLVSGIWHGANWTFVLWGVLHGLLCVFDRIFEKREENLFEPVRWGATFFGVNILWLLFRSDSITQWGNILFKMFTFQSMEISEGLINAFVLPETSFLFRMLMLGEIEERVRGLNLLIFAFSALLICLIPQNNYKKLRDNNWVTMILAAVAFVWGFLCLSSESVFVYFNF